MMKLIPFWETKLGFYYRHIEGRLYDVQGFKMILSDKEHVQLDIIKNGVYEWAETAVLPAFVRLGSVAIDVGANIGYHSLLLSRLVGNKGHVYAFEPLKINFDRLKANIRMNVGNVTPINVALGDSQETHRYRFDPIIGKGVVNLGEWSMINTKSDDGNVLVRTIPLDCFVQERHVQNVRFMKIDVEGFELRVLKGAYETIKEFRPIIMMEFSIIFKSRKNPDIERIQEFLDSMKYTICRIHKSPWPHIRTVIPDDFKNEERFNAICYYGRHPVHV